MEVKTIFCTQYRLIEGEKFAEMAMNNINSNTFNLSCAAKRCKAKLFIQIRPPILVEVINGFERNIRNAFSTSNHEQIQHNCIHVCFSTKEDDGLCRVTRHPPYGKKRQKLQIKR